jgi:hypothetical protein
VHRTIRRHRPPGADESLAGHLTAKDALQVLVGAAAAEDVDLDRSRSRSSTSMPCVVTTARSFGVSPLPLPLHGRVPADQVS